MLHVCPGPLWTGVGEHLLRQRPGLRLREVVLTDAAAALGHHDRAEPRDDFVAVLIQPPRLHLDDAHLWSRRGFARLQAQALGIDRVANVDRMGEFDIRPSQVRDSVLTHVYDRQTQEQCDRQAGTDDDPSARDGITLRQIGVEVILVRVAGEQCEPGGVGLGNSPTEGMLIRGADFKVLEEAA